MTQIVRDLSGMREIRSRADLESLLDGPYRGLEIVFTAPDIPSEERERWSRRLNRNYHACGCGQATAAALLGIICSGVFAFLSWWRLGGLPDWKLLVGLVVGTGIIAAVTKEIAVGLARRNLHRDVMRLSVRMRET